ncbi:MAG: D-alanyl-D-alanine endopeptidase [bacterium]|jgi:D-alanyl-D-alanine endopeptidase (penicillin-binding protein 7)
MQQQQRQLHHLEKIVALCALFAVLFLTVGFAQADDKSDPHAVFLRSAVALVMDAKTGEVVLDKNSDTVAPIASITKLMTAMVVLDRQLDLEQRIVVSREDIDTMKGSRSRLRTGSVLTRKELLLLALMASENRAAAALARTYPGGTESFVSIMNAKAQLLGMRDTRFVEPTGLSSENVSSAHDLVRLVGAAHRYPLIREFTTRETAAVEAYGRMLSFRNTNTLVRRPEWDIKLSKTGYISEAGRCLVMFTQVAKRDLIVVLLDSWGRYSRIGDANRIRKWLESKTGDSRDLSS